MLSGARLVWPGVSPLPPAWGQTLFSLSLSNAHVRAVSCTGLSLAPMVPSATPETAGHLHSSAAVAWERKPHSGL